MKRLEIRRKLREISVKQDMLDLLDKVLLSEREREVIIMFYIDKKQMMDIADDIGVSEPTILKDHAKALDKIGKVIGNV